MLAVFFGALVGFACGAILGIVDCKKTYGIPHKAKPDDGAWYSNSFIEDCEREIKEGVANGNGFHY